MRSAHTRLSSLARGLLRSNSLRAAFSFGMGGVSFSVGALLLARYLPETDFGILALFLALVQVGLAVGPAGADLIINRRRLTPSVSLACSGFLTAGLAATAITVAAIELYEVPSAILPFLWLALLAAALSRMGAAFFQSQNRIAPALGLTQSHNHLLLLSVPLALVLNSLDLVFFTTVVAVGYAVTACAGWYFAGRSTASAGNALDIGRLWREGLSGMGIGLTALLLAQTERFVIPITLGYREMAEFGVLAAVAIAPFRMMQLAVGFTLLPRLAKADSPDTIHRMIRQDLILACGVGLAGGLAVFFLGPWIVSLFVGDKYVIAPELFTAAILVGWVRMIQAVFVATVNAVGATTHLAVLNGASWIALLVAAGSAWSLSHYGLLGVIVGVGIGWVTQTLAAFWLVFRVVPQRQRSQ